MLCALKETTNLDCHSQAEIDAASSLTAIVRYKTPYVYTTTNQPCFISFGLGDNVTVNSIFGLPQLKLWNADLSFSTNSLLANNIQTQFPLEYSKADTGLPQGIQFTTDQFIRPPCSTPSDHPSQHLHSTASLTFPSQRLNSSTTSQPLVTDSSVDGLTRRSVRWPSPA